MPLAPAFAMTAHSAQGQTLEDGAIVDFVLPPGGNIVTCYIAATRVRERSKLLIARPFPLEPFQNGLTGARDLLVQCWRGQSPDWDAVRARYNVTRAGVDCLVRKRKGAYTKAQWQASDDARTCKECVALHRERGEPWRCCRCLLWKATTEFQHLSSSNRCTWKRTCHACAEARCCARCGEFRQREQFSMHQWRRASGFCLTCAYRPCQTVEASNGKRAMPDFRRARRFVRASRRKACVRQV